MGTKTTSYPSSRTDPLISHYTSVQSFGAKGDGVTDDTRAIRAAIDAAPVGGTVWFPPGTYIVSKTVLLRPGTTYRGSNPQSSIIKQADGANLVTVLADESYLQNSRQTSSGIEIEDLGIDGNATRNRHGHGLVLMTDRCLVRHVIVSFPPETGIVLTDKNFNGTVLGNGNNAIENRIEDCTIIQPGTYGVWVVDTHSSGRQTDGYLLNNVVKNSLGAWAMRIERAAGWFIANNHVYHCAGSGIYLSHVAGTYFYCNEVDKFGFTQSPPNSYYGVMAEYFMGRFRPSIFIGNVCATPEGMFPRNLYTYYSLGGDQYGQSNLVLVGNVSHNDPIGQPPRAHHAYESTAFTYTTQPGGALEVSEAANTNDGAVTSEYMPKDAKVQLGTDAVATHTSLTAPLAAGLVGGVAGGAVVGGIGQAMRNRLAPPRDPVQEPNSLLNFIETLSRWEIDPSSFTPEIGNIYLTYFVPFQPAEVTQIISATGDKPARGADRSMIGVYEVLEAGELMLIGAAENGAGSFWSIPNSVTTVDLAPGFGPLPLLLAAGKPYAYAEIQVGGSPATRLGKVGNPDLMALEPRGSARFTGHMNLPASLPCPGERNASGFQLYARLISHSLAGIDDYQPSTAQRPRPSPFT